MMARQDPKQIIADYVSRPLGALQPKHHLAGSGQSTRPQGELRRGGGLGAKPTTVRFFQEREIPGRQLHEAIFENEGGKQEHWLCCAQETISGDWRFAGGGNISEIEHSPTRSHPWANLAAGWDREGFWSGGRVLDNGLDVVRVRLISKNGVLLEDMVQDGLVLFVSDQKVKGPLRVELYDRSGNLAGTHHTLS
ncbi:MAG: hypothetical protein M3Y39_04755 [Chloroflexota bacterium]|nr:hypothetical protein [Chloroflexota bacterium]